MMGTLAENLRSLTVAEQEYLLNNWTSQLAEVAQNDLNHQIALTDDIEDLHWLMTQPDWMQMQIASTGHYNNFLQALVTVAQYLPPALLSDALGMAQEIPKREDRAKVLSALAPHLSSDLMEEALEVIREIGGSDGQAIALQGFAPFLPLQAPNL